MTARLHLVMTQADFVRQGKIAFKNDFFEGRAHNMILGNVSAELHAQLKRRSCQIYTYMRLKVSPTRFYTYADLVVVCGEEQFEDSNQNLLLNPTVVVEVLAELPETEERLEKFQRYREHSSIMEYLLIAQNQYRLEHYVRQNQNQWLFAEMSNLSDRVQLPSINCSMTLFDIYHKVKLVETEDEVVIETF